MTGSTSDTIKANAGTAIGRSNGKCEGCGNPLADTFDLWPAIHHRKLRSRGGDHRTENLLILHRRCHAWAHDNPKRATELGWMVPSGIDPKGIDVTRFDPWA